MVGCPTKRLSRRGLRLVVFVGMLFGGEVSIMKLIMHSRPRGLAPCVGRFQRQKMRMIVSFFDYIKTVLFESGRWVFAIFDFIGVVLFIFPSLAVMVQNQSVTQLFGAIIFIISFTFANFTLYNKFIGIQGEQAVRMYLHSTGLSNAIKLEYVGTGRAEDVSIILEYDDLNGKRQSNKVKDYFPPEDPKMVIRSFDVTSLDPGQIIFFHLRGKKEASSNNRIIMTFRNTISNKVITIRREFPVS